MKIWSNVGKFFEKVDFLLKKQLYFFKLARVSDKPGGLGGRQPPQDKLGGSGGAAPPGNPHYYPRMWGFMVHIS